MEAGIELLTRLLGSGPDQRITQPVLYAVANLAARNTAAQDAIRTSGELFSLQHVGPNSWMGGVTASVQDGLNCQGSYRTSSTTTKWEMGPMD